MTETYLVDTNIFLELLLDQERADECQELLDAASSGEVSCVVTRFTVHAVEGMLGSKLDVTRTFLKNLENSIGIEVHATSIKEERQALRAADGNGLDFDDGIQYWMAREQDVDAIISFDTDFDNIDIDRKAPEQVL